VNWRLGAALSLAVLGSAVAYAPELAAVRTTSAPFLPVGTGLYLAGVAVAIWHARGRE